MRGLLALLGALRDDVFNVGALEVSLGEQAIVRPAKQLQVVGAIAAAASPRVPVMKL